MLLLEYILADNTFPVATFKTTMKLFYGVHPLWAINKTPSGLNFNPLIPLSAFCGNTFAQYIFALLEIDNNAIYGIRVIGDN